MGRFAFQAIDGNPSAKTPPSMLLFWLNLISGADQGPLGKPSKASRARVASLLREIIDTSAMLTAMDAEDPNIDFFDDLPDTVAARLGQIQTFLNKYPKWPVIEIAYDDAGVVLKISDASGPGRPLGEQLAVWDIARLTGSGQLSRVRQCDCRQWYYAARNDQRSCSARCRHKTYEQTEAFKESRRIYMRGYYALKQSGKVK